MSLESLLKKVKYGAVALLIAGTLNAQSLKGNIYSLWGWQNKLSMNNATITLTNGAIAKTAKTDVFGSYTIDNLTGVEDIVESSVSSIVAWVSGRDGRGVFHGPVAVKRITGHNVLGQELFQSDNAVFDYSRFSAVKHQYLTVELEDGDVYRLGFVQDAGQILGSTQVKKVVASHSNVLQLKKAAGRVIWDVKISGANAWEYQTRVAIEDGVNVQDFYVAKKVDYPDTLVTFFESINLSGARPTGSLTAPAPTTFYFAIDTTKVDEKNFFTALVDLYTKPVPGMSNLDGTPFYFNDAFKTPYNPEGMYKDIKIVVGPRIPKDTPGIYRITIEDSLGDVASSYEHINQITREIDYGDTYWDRSVITQLQGVKTAAFKEAIRGYGRNNTQKSMWNSPVHYTEGFFQLESDRKLNLLKYTRAPGHSIDTKNAQGEWIDKDPGWDYKNNSLLK